VRDLAWVISSPCIIEQVEFSPSQDFFSSEFEGFLPALNELEKNPKELVELLAKSKRKSLGTYFEDLVEFWLSKRVGTKILARNLQVIDDKTTLGECDFIAEIDGEITHIEVAIKYYLAVENSAEQRFWVGRGLTDRLDIKYEKLFKQQLQLSNSLIMSELLAQKNIDNITKKMAIIKGYFFQYYFAEKHELPKFAPKDMEESFWCRISEIDSLPEQYSKWQILHKPHWLTYSQEDIFDRSELQTKILDYFANIKETPVLCNSFAKGRPHEPIKFFIAPISWNLYYLPYS